MDSKKIYGANIGNIFLTQMQFIEILLPKNHFPPLFGNYSGSFLGIEFSSTCNLAIASRVLYLDI